MDALLDRFRDQVRRLCTVAVAGLSGMVDPASGLLVFRVAGEEGGGLCGAGASLRYTAITLLGLERAERAGFSLGLDVGRLYQAVGETIAGAENAGDLGLVLWAAATTCRPLAERALRDLRDFDDVRRRRGGGVVHTTELCWVVTGLAEALVAGVGDEREVRARLDRAYAYLLGQRGRSGLFCFARPLARAPRSPAAILRSELGFFDAQVYGIVACLSRDAAVGDPEAREIAQRVGERLLAHQHRLGQWGWHYNVRTGALVDLYPVYSVHQDGMAPMALLWLERATGTPTTPAVARGVDWLFGRNELGESLVDEERGVIWRSVRRRGWRRRVVYPLKAASLLRLGRGLDLGGRLSGPSGLEVDRECRPYHLGFCLYALAELASEPVEELAEPFDDPSPTLKTGDAAASTPLPRGIAPGMRVLHVLDRSLPVVAGYTTRAAAIVEHQMALGLEPVALTGVRQGTSPAGIIQGVPHHRTPAPTAAGRRFGAPLLGEAAEMMALGQRILEVHRETPFDLVHAHSPILCGLPALAAARRLGLPAVYEVRALWEDAAEQRGRGRHGSARYGAIRAAETLLGRSVDALVVICEGLQRELLARGLPPERVTVVPNGVDTERFSPRPRDEALAERYGFRGKLVIAYLGTLFRFEGANLLLSALRGLLSRRDDVRGLVIGAGEAEAELRERHATLGLGDRVVLTGAVPPAEVAGLYTLADVLAYPRERHRITDLVTPLKPLEAMSMGKLVVGSDVGGLRELIRDGDTGLLFRAGDARDLERVLLRAVSDAGLRRRIGERARRHVVEHRDWRRVAARYLDVYAAAARRRGRELGPSAPLSPRC